MAAAIIDLMIEQGATFAHRFIWQDIDGDPIDLTLYTARMDIKSKVTDTTPLLTLTTENGGITLGGVLGTIDLLISSTVTTALTWSWAYYDIELVAAYTVTRLVRGRVSVSPEVTTSA